MLPNEIELPRPEDFCRGTYKTMSGNQCCFLGWKYTVFLRLNKTESLKFNCVAIEEAKKLKMVGSSIPSVNDNLNHTAKKLALWFERTIERMGYDIG